MIDILIKSIGLIKSGSLRLVVLSLLIASVLIPAVADEEEKSFDYLYLEGLRQKLKGEHEAAFESFQSALQINPSSSAALYEISRYFIAQRNTAVALDLLERAVENSPDNLYYKLSLANIYRDAGQLDKAVALYEEITQKHPDRAEVHIYLSDLYLRLNEPEKAIHSLDNLENNIGMNEMISYQKYQLYRALEENNKALKEIEKLAAKFPSESQYLIIIGDHYLEFQNNKKALEYYNKAYALNPNDPYYFISMANYYEQEGNEEMVYKEIENALKSTDLDAEQRMDILDKYLKHSRKIPDGEKKVDALMQALLSQALQDSEINMVYGDYLFSLERVEEAKFQYQLATETDPMNKKAWLSLTRAIITEGNDDELLKACDEALKFFPEVPNFYYYKVVVYYNKDEYEKVFDVLIEAIENIPHATNRMIVSDFYGQLGDLYSMYEESEYKEEMYYAYEDALKLNENNVVVLNNYAYYLSLDKSDLDKAERMAAKAVQLEPNNPTYLDTYAWVFFQKGNYSLAKFYIEDALLNADGVVSPDIYQHYGDILFKTGNEEKAVLEWQKALNILNTQGTTDELLKKKIIERTYYEAE